MSLAFSSRATLGLMIPAWGNEFGWSREFLSSGGAIMLVVMAMIAPVAGTLIDRFGPRFLFAGGALVFGSAMAATGLMAARWQFVIVFCIANGIGFATASAPLAAAAIARRFEANRALATSVATTGVGIGQLLLVPLFALVVSLIGWRPTFAGFGVVCIAVGVLAWFLVGDDRRHAPPGARRRDSALEAPLAARVGALFGNPNFLLLGGAYMICGFTTAGILKVHLLPYAALCGFPPVEGASAYGVMAGFNVVGLLLSGWLADRMHRPLLLGSVYFLRAFTFILLMHIGGDSTLLFAFAVAFGTLDFATVAPTASLAASHLGVRTIGLTMGALFCCHSIGGATGAWLGGWFYDMFARYDGVWLAGLAAALVAAVLAWSVRETRGAVPAAAAA
jgi:predicted MFS family arabinose efflux permease